MKHLISVAILALAVNANAATVTFNETTSPRLDSTFLDVGQSHWDTTTGLEWLDFGALVGDPITFGHSINSAEASYGASNGSWRLADYDEVYGLFDMFFPIFTDSGDGSMSLIEDESSDIIQARNSWFLAFGTDAPAPANGTSITTNDSITLSSRGFYLDAGGAVQELGVTITGAPLESKLYGPDYRKWVTGRDEEYTNYGIFMVRDYSVVPVPAAVWLFASGLIGLVAVARRKA